MLKLNIFFVLVISDNIFRYETSFLNLVSLPLKYRYRSYFVYSETAVHKLPDDNFCICILMVIKLYNVIVTFKQFGTLNDENVLKMKAFNFATMKNWENNSLTFFHVNNPVDAPSALPTQTFSNSILLRAIFVIMDITHTLGAILRLSSNSRFVIGQ